MKLTINSDSFRGKRMHTVNQEKSGNTLILKKQDLVLLKRSEEAKNTEIYGNLYECLKQYTTLSTKELEGDIVFDSKARMALKENLELMMKNVKDEWFSKTSFEIATEEVHCQLCGAKNTYICYIQNRNNGEELHVGSECVKHFPDINGINVALKNLNRDKRDITKEVRRSNFNVALGEDINFTKYAKEKVDTFPIELPYKLYTDIEDAINSCNRIRTSYIQSGGNIDECIDKFKIKKEEFNDLYNEAKQYYEDNKSNPLICTRVISMWLKDNYPTIITDIRKAKGILNESTLQFIHEPEFVNKNLGLFSECIKDKDVSILNLNGNTIRFKIENKCFIQPIYFSMTIKSFMKYIGCRCLTQSGYKYSKTSLSPQIENTLSNLDAVLNFYNGILEKSGYRIIIEEKTSELYWEKRQNLTTKQWSRHLGEIKPIYKVTSIDKIFSIMSYVLFNDNASDKEIVQIITRKIDASGKWITKEDKNRRVEIASEAAGMQKQREFTPYL